LAYNFINPIIIAFVLWFIGFVCYLFSIKSYRKIKEEYFDEYNREDGSCQGSCHTILKYAS